MTPYALGFAIALFWRRRQYRLILGRVEAVLDVGLTEIRNAIDNTTDAMTKFAAALGNLEEQEASEFKSITSDVSGRRISPDSRLEKEPE